ncbi:hypothetical protein V2J09_010504 [Rumex salicifolius]
MIHLIGKLSFLPLIISLVEKWNRAEGTPQVAYTFDAGPNAVLIARNRKVATNLLQRLLFHFPPSNGVDLNRLELLNNAFWCHGCPLTLHKSCSELDRGNTMYYFEPENLPKFLRMKPNVAYKFPKECACVGCREEGKEFSSECRSCVFESHLKSRLLPTIVHHEAHEHLLAVAAKSIMGSDPYIYVACMKHGAFVAYFCTYCTLTTYHTECELLPPLVEHDHGGHEHELEMAFHREAELEDYLCDLCQNKMDPKSWYYHCKKCILSLHLGCAFMDFD